jgi:hypothetical protein
MPKRFHLKRPDLALAVASALEDCNDVRSQQRLLAMRLAASGQFTAAQIAEQIAISRRQLFPLGQRARGLDLGGLSHAMLALQQSLHAPGFEGPRVAGGAASRALEAGQGDPVLAAPAA